jgi:hypothetical protein
MEVISAATIPATMRRMFGCVVFGLVGSGMIGLNKSGVA